MTTYSLSDMATRVLKDQGLIAAEEVPSATDLEWAEETVSAEIAMLAALGMPIWNGSAIAVPQEYLTPLSRRIGLAFAPSFGLMTVAQAEAAMPLAETNLRRMATIPATGEILQVDYI